MTLCEVRLRDETYALKEVITFNPRWSASASHTLHLRARNNEGRTYCCGDEPCCFSGSGASGLPIRRSSSARIFATSGSCCGTTGAPFTAFRPTEEESTGWEGCCEVVINVTLARRPAQRYAKPVTHTQHGLYPREGQTRFAYSRLRACAEHRLALLPSYAGFSTWATRATEPSEPFSLGETKIYRPHRAGVVRRP